MVCYNDIKGEELNRMRWSTINDRKENMGEMIAMGGQQYV